MGYKIILTASFLEDLESIVSYLRQKAEPETALRVGNELVEAALALKDNPAVGQRVKGRPGARKILLYSYSLLYDVDESKRRVEVIRIWHGARHPRSLRFPKKS